MSKELRGQLAEFSVDGFKQQAGGERAAYGSFEFAHS
jgi:hypothetical protein